MAGGEGLQGKNISRQMRAIGGGTEDTPGQEGGSSCQPS